GGQRKPFPTPQRCRDSRNRSDARHRQYSEASSSPSRAFAGFVSACSSTLLCAYLKMPVTLTTRAGGGMNLTDLRGTPAAFLRRGDSIVRSRREPPRNASYFLLPHTPSPSLRGRTNS